MSVERSWTNEKTFTDRHVTGTRPDLDPRIFSQQNKPKISTHCELKEVVGRFVQDGRVECDLAAGIAGYSRKYGYRNGERLREVLVDFDFPGRTGANDHFLLFMRH